MGWAIIVSTLIASFAYIVPKLLAIYAQMNIVERQMAAMSSTGGEDHGVDWRAGYNAETSTGGGYV